MIFYLWPSTLLLIAIIDRVDGAMQAP